mmetsp:Transcript_15472/g.49153  ORF Transcript_15472/g.49153 Transcript_15472/m.49153 type:complete len:251 (+) Transcript_15472:297-1049(+)
MGWGVAPRAGGRQRYGRGWQCVWAPHDSANASRRVEAAGAGGCGVRLPGKLRRHSAGPKSAAARPAAVNAAAVKNRQRAKCPPPGAGRRARVRCPRATHRKRKLQAKHRNLPHGARRGGVLRALATERRTPPTQRVPSESAWQARHPPIVGRPMQRTFAAPQIEPRLLPLERRSHHHPRWDWMAAASHHPHPSRRRGPRRHTPRRPCLVFPDPTRRLFPDPPHLLFVAPEQCPPRHPAGLRVARRRWRAG